MEMSRAHLTAD